ncbi:hypothetical protein EIP91_004844 [Steccherinum ochraceum]|uniref:BHLH domain-containing protein n=1 Tax=Steccherinum ochraceum TaxID=92696 RepID=A0A4R0RU95_9APHY|nr:hypothetical protein EIP91_004844 [Steccherinum ochraceum]
METAHMEHVLDHTKSDNFMDTSSNYFDSIGPMDYLQYPHSPSFGVSMGLPSTGSPRIGFNSLNLNNGMSEYTYSSTPNYTTSSPTRPFTPTGSIYPGALSNLSAGELSSDRTASPPPAAVVAAAPQKKRAKGGSDEFASDDDEDFNPIITATTNEARREEIRRQRIESEQRRRDELRDGYRRLKDALPVSNQKSSKVSLLDRATTHIRYLEMTQQQLQTRLAQAEAETNRLRHVNEALMLGTAEQRHAAAASAVAAAQQQAPAGSF